MVDIVAQHLLEVSCVLVGVLVLSVFIDFFGHKDGHTMGFKESILWFVFWVCVAIAYYFYIDFRFGAEWANMYISGYALEKSLSVDNMIVMMAIFSSFGIKSGALQHKILLCGIAGALIFRGIFVAAGTALFNLHWSIQVIFGLVVAWSALAIFKGGEEEEETDYTKHWAVGRLSKWFSVSTKLNGTKFTLVEKGVKYLTPAFVCMVVIELSDVMFSFDSVPAVIGVTKEPILVYSAMILAILGLRSLYFVLASLMKYLVHLEKAVGVVLVFIGVKLISHALEIAQLLPESTKRTVEFMNDATNSVCIVLGLIIIGIVASILFPDKEEQTV